MTGWFIAGTAAAAAALLLAERSDSWWRRPVKAVASTGFIVLALASGALDTGYGRLILLGLALAWVGDLALTFVGRPAFLIGLAAFLLGHVAYVAAFVERGIGWSAAFWGAACVTLVAVVVWHWLRPHLDEVMRLPVAAYVAVISLMVATASGTSGSAFDARILVGAVMFFASDLAVARNRFVHPGFINRAWGLPLYYCGQVLLALSVSG